MRQGFPADGGEQRRRVGVVVGTGIDNRDLAAAYDVTHRAGKGERARIVAENPPRTGADFIDNTGLERKVAVERDVVVVGHGGFLRNVSCTVPEAPTAVIPRESGVSSNRVRSR